VSADVSKLHELKTWPAFYARIIDGSKRFEIRRDDRVFQSGDCVALQEWDPETETYTGREAIREIGFVTGFQQRDGFVVFSLHNSDESATSERWRLIAQRREDLWGAELRKLRNDLVEAGTGGGLMRHDLERAVSMMISSARELGIGNPHAAMMRDLAREIRKAHGL